MAEFAGWDDFVRTSVNGTIFHQRRFLAYHGARFSHSEKWLVALKGETVIGQLAIAVEPWRPDEPSEHRRLALSPYGGSYGGYVLREFPTFAEATALAELLSAFLRTSGVNEARLVHIPNRYMHGSLDTLVYALTQVGFDFSLGDICGMVDLTKGPIESSISSRARNMERKALKAGVQLVHNAPLKDFWPVLEATMTRHETAATHTFEHLEYLERALSGDLFYDVAYLEERPVGAAAYMNINAQTQTAFYFAQTSVGREVQALSALVTMALRQAQALGKSIMDFGTSSSGGIPRPNIFAFKEAFGRESVARPTLTWTGC